MSSPRTPCHRICMARTNARWRGLLAELHFGIPGCGRSGWDAAQTPVSRASSGLELGGRPSWNLKTR